ncbi:hypothetical protein SAMD00020551_4576 [Mesobacillus selenatarsenatis SF-1]|uniref:Uncharacterized protein n=1 Tax=Mesobacillus selenatarsenatis (strain DSM 18680 / JCM 14380 / FERM P-15431 / SF-1) TaxID=1321606 RepID=A0A0A8XE41_MESS1|nr:hypothetical protein SAMD00020551_4576 [Mesobacillus selenatarsenatis SF-1]
MTSLAGSKRLEELGAAAGQVSNIFTRIGLTSGQTGEIKKSLTYAAGS